MGSIEPPDRTSAFGNVAGTTLPDTVLASLPVLTQIMDDEVVEAAQQIWSS